MNSGLVLTAGLGRRKGFRSFVYEEPRTSETARLMIGNDQLNLSDAIGIAARYWRRWLVPAAIVSVVAVAYALLKPDTWQAEQALIVRNEALGRESPPGKFRQPEEMKTLLETTLELVRSRGVLAEALTMVGPPASVSGRPEEETDPWPNDRAIEDLRGNVKLAAPKGAEFGKTEIFYLQVRDRERSRALALCKAITDRLQQRAKALRNVRAESMIAELERSAALARQDLWEATARLSAIEANVGGDLAELRAMGEGNAGDSALRRTATEIRAELRATEAQIQAHRELLTLLAEARSQPPEKWAIPQRLLDAQPTLRQLHSGLLDARLNVARLAGRMAPDHPLLIAAEEACDVVEHQMHDELSAAVRAMSVELTLAEQRRHMLEERLAGVNARLDRLAELRADYLNLLAEVNNRKTLLDRNEQSLAEARAAKAGAEAASLIAAVGEPDTGARPLGPSRSVLAAAGLAGGLLCGLGLLCFSLPLGAAASCDPRFNRLAGSPTEQAHQRKSSSTEDGLATAELSSPPETVGPGLPLPVAVQPEFPSTPTTPC